MSHLSTVKIISKEIKDAIEPLTKWIAVHHAIERGDSNTLLKAQFPWLNLLPPDQQGPAQSPPTVKDTQPESLKHPDIPEDACRTIWSLMHLSPTQIDTIMSLVSCAENGASDWPLFYNYIEYGDDASSRGYTCTIFGACSGTGSLRQVFAALKQKNKNHPLVKTYWNAIDRARGGDISGLEGLAHVDHDPTKAKANYSKWTRNGRTHLDHIQGDLATLPLNDGDWRWAVWKAFIDLNWVSANDFCTKSSVCGKRPGAIITSALGKGIMVDTSLNHGDCHFWNSAPTWTILFNTMKNPDETDERAWLRDFLTARKEVLKSGYKSLDWSASGSRCEIWLALLDAGCMDLERPLEIPKSTATPHPIWPDGLVLQ
jgi:hypothetical protein